MSATEAALIQLQNRLPAVALATAFALSLAACAAFDPELRSDSPKDPTLTGVPVPAAAETQAVGTARSDAADDPEIWADPRDPSRAVIFGTDKKAGLYVYGLDGEVRAFLPEGPLNNVDLRPGFLVGEREQVLAAASHRTRGGALLFLMDPATLEVKTWGLASAPVSEPYGLCMGRRGEDTLVVVVGQAGDVRQLRVAAEQGRPTWVEEQAFAVGSQAEGCVIDDATGALYVGEEAKGIWRYSIDPAKGGARTLLEPAPGPRLTPDVEGLTLLRDSGKTYLIASSQGDNAFAVWRVLGETADSPGRFPVAAAGDVDAVTGTDGVAALGGPGGPYPEGLIVVPDDADTEGATGGVVRERQNFKLVDWRAVKSALEIDPAAP